MVCWIWSVQIKYIVYGSGQVQVSNMTEEIELMCQWLSTLSIQVTKLEQKKVI